MKLLFDAAADELHTHLSEWAHCEKPQRFIVRRLRSGSNTITVDIVRPQPVGVDRLVLTFAPHEAGNCDADGVNLQQRKLPTTISAVAGTLTTTQRQTTVGTLRRLQCWMREVAQVCNYLYVVGR